MEYLFETQGITKRFGGLVAVDHVDLQVVTGEIRGLIGPNGSGKSTMLNLISGVYTSDEGTVRFKDQAINHLLPHKRAELGIARTFQNNRLFLSLSILENVMVGQHCRTSAELFMTFFQPKKAAEEENLIRERAKHFLDFVGLKRSPGYIAGALPHGERRLLEIARAMATEPSILLLDEPATGMNPTEKERLVQVIKKIRDEGITVFLIEHNMKVVMGICDKVSVLNFGKKIAEGTPYEIQHDQNVIEAYLGEDDEEEEMNDAVKTGKN